MKKPNHPARLGGSLLLALLCLEFAPMAHAGGEEFALCAKKYPDSNAERLKCYDNAQAAATVSDLPQPEDDPEDDEETPPATAPAPMVARSYLTRTWNLDDRTSHDESKLGRLIPHRLNYLLVRKTFNAN